MSDQDTCTFCPAERYTSIFATEDPTQEPDEIPVCIDCLNKFEQAKRGV